MIFETHAHYDDEAFTEDREELIESFQWNDIGYVVNIGANVASSQATLELCRKYPFFYGAVGVHPNDVGDMTSADMVLLRQMAMDPKIVAIGEIGLDYYYPEPAHEIQKAWFVKQLELARELKMPVVIHSREAAKDTVDIMHEMYAEEIGGVVHCYSYSKEIAKEILDMGFYIGIGGVLTFQNAKRLQEVVEMLPIERIVLETDSPYLAPEPNRGQRNSSLNIPHIAKKIAQIKQMEYDDVIAITEQNAKDLYRIS
ncbi:MAG: TatD family hydrolase [Lachnospiraceae bacterium]